MKILIQNLSKALDAKRLLLDINGGHESHQNLWMTYQGYSL